MSIFSTIKSHAVLATTILVVAIAGAVIAGRVAARSKQIVATTSNTKHVTLVDVSSFNNTNSTVAASGVVQSVSQVDLKSQFAAPIATLNVSLGDTVAAGQIIAVLSNQDIQAQVSTARATVSVNGVSVDAARKAAVDTLDDAYIKADDVVHSNVDPLLLNTVSNGPQLSTYINDRNLYTSIRDTRTDLNAIFNDWIKLRAAISATSSDVQIEAAFTKVESNISVITGMLDKILTGLNAASTVTLSSDATTLSTWKATISGARTTMSTLASTLTTAEKAFSIAASGVQGSVAQLDKTIIRSPINGKVAALPLRVGELASPGSLIATVVGPGGLQVDAFASGDDISRVSKGASAVIDGSAEGVVTSVAPSINLSNKKAEVKVLITNPGVHNLVVGENVPLIIQATRTAASETSVFRLPIQDVKIVPGEAFVFTVGTSSELIKNNVMLGKVSGDYVEVIRGLTPDMKIATPVYELNEGQQVIVDEGTQ